MVFTKKAAKTPAVMVETKKLSTKDTCGMECCGGNMKHLLVPVLLVLNTLLLIRVLCVQMNGNIESEKVGGKENYKMVQQIYKSDVFKAQQKQQIEQALQMYQSKTTPAAQPTTVQQDPTVQQNPTVQQAPTTTPTVQPVVQ